MASGDTLYSWTAAAGIVDDSNGPSHQKRGVLPTLAFDATTNETAYFVGTMPGQYDGTSSLVVKIGAVHFQDGDTSNAAEFEISFARMQDDTDNVETLTWDTAVNLDWTSANANDEIAYDVTSSIANSAADGIQPNETFAVRVVFDASEWSDSGDVEFISMELQLA